MDQLRSGIKLHFLFTLILVASFQGSSHPIEHSKDLCTSLLSSSEISKSPSIFRPQIRSVLSSLREPRVRIIWGTDIIGKAKQLGLSVQIEPGLYGENISDPQIPQIPIPKSDTDTPFRSKSSFFVVTQTNEREDLARIPAWTEFRFMQISADNRIYFGLIAEAEPRTGINPFLDLRTRQFVLNTLIALAATPYSNFVSFKHRLERSSDLDQQEVFKRILAKKMAGRSDREAIKDIYSDQEALLALSSPILRLEKLSIKFFGDDRTPLETQKIGESKSIETYYLFYAPSPVIQPPSSL